MMTCGLRWARLRRELLPTSSKSHGSLGEAALEDYLLTGGSIQLARGNKGADILADRGAKLAAPPDSILWKEHLVKQIARLMQTMQVSIWAAFRGHICSGLEYTAAEVAALIPEEGLEVEDDYNELDFIDPFMHKFLCQEDCEFDTAYDETDLF